MAAWLWLYGPPGVGKSTTGFEIYEQLARRGARVAFVELDQIGMVMPAPVEARSAAKADNLLGMLDNLSSVGADGVVVCGDVVETMGGLLARAREQPVLCRLRADDEVTVERLTIRRSLHYAMSSSAYDAFDAPVADLDVITHPLGPSEVAAEVLRRLGEWPPSTGGSVVSVAPAAPVLDDVDAVLVTGPRGVGASTVAWQALMGSVAAGVWTGYLDLQQLGFLAPPLAAWSRAVTLANVATCWAGFRDQGAERLVLCGHADADDVAALREVVPSLRVVALTATPSTMLERVGRRGRQKDLWLPGDDLFGRDDGYLQDVASRAASFDAGYADAIIATDGLSPADIAGRVASLWPRSARR